MWKGSGREGVRTDSGGVLVKGNMQADDVYTRKSALLKKNVRQTDKLADISSTLCKLTIFFLFLIGLRQAKVVDGIHGNRCIRGIV